MENKKIVIITAPSGAGKTSIVQYLLQKYPHLLAFSISATTRQPRANETPGLDYYFISQTDFQDKIRDNKFIEWEMVYEGKYYGTLVSEIDRIWSLGKTPVLDVDVKGALRILERYPDSTLSIFIEAPSVDELRKRLESRGTETPESLAARVNKATYELSFKHHFHRVIVNDELSRARNEAASVIIQYLSGS